MTQSEEDKIKKVANDKFDHPEAAERIITFIKILNDDKEKQ